MFYKPKVIAIVGSDERKWTPEKERIAKFKIKTLMKNYPYALFISGECPKGGIDIWVKEIAYNENKRFKAFPPKQNSWYYYKKRNKQMAEEADIVIDIEPSGYTSGGEWTLNYAKLIGKKGFKIII